MDEQLDGIAFEQPFFVLAMIRLALRRLIRTGLPSFAVATAAMNQERRAAENAAGVAAGSAKVAALLKFDVPISGGTFDGRWTMTPSSSELRPANNSVFAISIKGNVVRGPAGRCSISRTRAAATSASPANATASVAGCAATPEAGPFPGAAMARSLRDEVELGATARKSNEAMTAVAAKR